MYPPECYINYLAVFLLFVHYNYIIIIMTIAIVIIISIMLCPKNS